ncbi:ubiquinone biosynthesis methyltransferase UbiE [Planctomycetaceae bacterium SCGC AG-212-F19]|nr:ubiquinone biosynthesis methyltransferase UbiE [Planctomycetaceae bacterium SCGC AG-212-F19]
MGFYSEVILPRLCDLALGTAGMTALRRELLASVSGNILEIGFGTGLNLPCYPAPVRKITVIDPNPGMHRLAQRRIRSTGIEVDQRIMGSESLPFADASFDHVVSTFTLCSIDQVDRALGQIGRVLRPGGRFIFLEHGLSPEAGVQRWQRRLNWLQMRLGGGCRLDRQIGDLVIRHPFAGVELERFYLPAVPRTHGYLYRGSARK